jgi:hypothetical protein
MRKNKIIMNWYKTAQQTDIKSLFPDNIILQTIVNDEGNIIDGTHTIKISDSTLIINVDFNSSLIDLISLRTINRSRNSGFATEAMKQLVQCADALNFSIKLLASPLDKRTKLNRLVDFYSLFGFSLTGERGNMAGEPIMVRNSKI